MKRIIYIGCSLTHAPPEFVAGIKELKDRLRDDYNVLDFIGLTDGTPQDVYHSDIELGVGGCELFVAVCDYPSIGLGYELGTAIERYHKPVLAVAHREAKVTRMLEGLPDDLYSLKQYGDLSEIPRLIEAKFKSLPIQQETPSP